MMLKTLITIFIVCRFGIPLFATVINLQNISVTGPDAPTPAERYAITELTNHLKKIGNNTIELNGNTEIRLITDTGLHPDGYNIRFAGNNLEIRGGGNFGLIYGVYAVLEEDLGCRWYEPEITVIPAPGSLVFKVKERTSKPAFPVVRDPFCSMEGNVAWALRNRCIKTMGRNIPKELGNCISYPRGPEFWMAHTMNLFCPPALFKEHPEYFMQDVNGKRSPRQICPSHPDVRNLAADKVRSVLRKYPQHNILNLSLEDNHDICHCPDCLNAWEREGTGGAAFFELVNHVAEKVAVEFPNVKISFLAYYSTFLPPEKMKMVSNTVCFLAFLGGRNMSKPVELQESFPAILQGWQEAAPEIHIWDYQVFFPNFMQYELSLHSVMENLRYYRKFDNITGIMLQGSYCGPGGERQGLRAWVESKLLWDPDRDVWELSQDYIRGVYGVAAPEVEKFYHFLNDLEKRHQQYQTHQTEIMNNGAAAFRNAKVLAANDPVLLERLELAELPVIIWELDSIMGDRYRNIEIDKDKVNSLLNQLHKVVERQKITNISEGGSIKKYLENCRAVLNEKNLTYRDTLDKASSVIPARDGKTYGAKLEKDPQSIALEIIRLSPDNNWSWQMRMDKINLPEGKYRFRLRCRAVKTGEKQTVLHFGMHDVAKAAQAGRSIPASQLLHSNYRWHDLGIFPVNSGSTLYTMLQAKDNHMELYIEALEITPVGD